MIKPADCLGYQPMDASGGHETADYGYFGLDVNITRALGKRSHLGYSSESCTWESNLSDFGYYSINRGIERALKRLARS